MKTLKYLSAYIVPGLFLLGLFNGGMFVWTPVLFAFVCIPILEPLLKKDDARYSEEEKESRLQNVFFDLLLYLNVPMIFTFLFLLFFRIEAGLYEGAEIAGLITSMGILLGACGINVAHELGHRDSKWEQFLAKVLLMPSQYMHFFIEHNRGHHKAIATDEDAASARFKEPLYAFWIRSTVGQYKNAWALEAKRLKRKGKGVVSIENEMMIFTIVQIGFIGLLLFLFSPIIVGIYLVIAAISILLLETINYVEHYGLRREKKANGHYETVKVWHSWNSNHTLGRIVLYELTRHSDHHFQSNKKYQILEHKDKAPQLPYGYPSSMLLALVPPLWFRVMNKRIEELQQ